MRALTCALVAVLCAACTSFAMCTCSLHVGIRDDSCACASLCVYRHARHAMICVKFLHSRRPVSRGFSHAGYGSSQHLVLRYHPAVAQVECAGLEDVCIWQN
ncbi:hypothetical protein BaRGS_00018690 [Batillaria attramentaria]|uniref:Secreted protein n=1 Tax=Batillaria attramentaria TaxID=370345 RepID=A0ABD0KRR1_9CAEN